jgi:hypothetical protein
MPTLDTPPRARAGFVSQSSESKAQAEIVPKLCRIESLHTGILAVCCRDYRLDVDVVMVRQSGIRIFGVGFRK